MRDRLRRLRPIEGQVRGLQRMVEDLSDVSDILTEISAATPALQAFSLGLVEEHLAGCVDAATSGGTVAEERIHEATVAVSRLLRSRSRRSRRSRHGGHPGPTARIEGRAQVQAPGLQGPRPRASARSAPVQPLRRLS